jgi:D-3-phosphoglycerate dehydrogenase
MRILAVGDSFLTVDVMRAGLQSLRSAEVEYLQLDESDVADPATESQRRIHEYTGRPEQLRRGLRDVEVLLVHGAPVTDEVLDASSALRMVGCARGGPVNVDLAAASERGLPVATAPGKNAEAVADQTVALLVMLARGFPRAMRFIAEGGTTGASAFEGAQFLGHDLNGHVLGLVGYGRVAQRVAVRARAFGMELLYFDPYRTPQPDDLASSVASLSELLGGSDFVSIHARKTEDNENMFSTEMLARMRPGSFLINTARDGLLDEDALDAALSSGQLAGAGLDVVRQHSGDGAHRLLRHDNVVLLPHIGGATHETLLRGVTMLAQAVTCLQDGLPLPYLANPEVLEPACATHCS